MSLVKVVCSFDTVTGADTIGGKPDVPLVGKITGTLSVKVV